MFSWVLRREHQWTVPNQSEDTENLQDELTSRCQGIKTPETRSRNIGQAHRKQFPRRTSDNRTKQPNASDFPATYKRDNLRGHTVKGSRVPRTPRGERIVSSQGILRYGDRSTSVTTSVAVCLTYSRLTVLTNRQRREYPIPRLGASTSLRGS